MTRNHLPMTTPPDITPGNCPHCGSNDYLSMTDKQFKEYIIEGKEPNPSECHVLGTCGCQSDITPEWEKEFDEKFVNQVTPIDQAITTRAHPNDVKAFISLLIAKKVAEARNEQIDKIEEKLREFVYIPVNGERAIECSGTFWLLASIRSQLTPATPDSNS